MGELFETDKGHTVSPAERPDREGSVWKTGRPTELNFSVAPEVLRFHNDLFPAVARGDDGGYKGSLIATKGESIILHYSVLEQCLLFE